jgi:acyl phosphate:glycerol-3-phosphate acyltransferase
MSPFLLLPFAYLLGAIPTSLWVGKTVYGIDLRTVGSGNLGATNALRALGWKAALPVVIVDVFKGWLPAWLFPRLDSSSAWAWAVAYGAAAILGHVYSLWARFRGGKGVATSGGVFIALAPWAALVATSAWFLVAALTRISSAASLTAALALPFAVWLTPHEGGQGLVAFSAALSAFVIWAHRANIRRLMRGEEKPMGKKA